MSTAHPSLEKIHASIPHRGPMLLVDEIVSLENNAIVCRKRFNESEFFFQGHYPDQPIVPGVILCESAVQSGAILLADLITENQDMVPVLTRMGDVKFKKIIKPDDEIENSVKVDEVVSTAYYMTAQVRCDGKLAARLSFTCSLAPKEG